MAAADSVDVGCRGLVGASVCRGQELLNINETNGEFTGSAKTGVQVYVANDEAAVTEPTLVFKFMTGPWNWQEVKQQPWLEVWMQQSMLVIGGTHLLPAQS